MNPYDLSFCKEGGDDPPPISLHSYPSQKMGVCRGVIKKTEGLELGAVDKLLVGIFVGCDGEEERILFSLIPDHPIYFALLANRI